MRRKISAKRTGTSVARRCAFIIFAWICRTRMAVLSRRIRPKQRKPFAMANVAAFDFFGGVRLSSPPNHTERAVAKIVEGGRRRHSKRCAELQSHSLFEDRHPCPGDGNVRRKV